MANSDWSPIVAAAEIQRLISPGVLGFYTQFEATEVFASIQGVSAPFNVFSLLVAENRDDGPPQKEKYLNPTRIRLKTLDGWTFGVKQYSRLMTDLANVFEDLNKTGKWSASGQPLQVGNLVPVPTRFVPPDSINKVPWNRVLKNNFWNGSHLVEWADSQKAALQPLFDDPRRLQDLSEAVQECVPIGLASLSDRLGNIAVQLPVTVLMAQFTGVRGSGDLVVKVAWHPQATSRALRANCELEDEGTISGCMSADIREPQTRLHMQPGQGLHRGVIWDDHHRVILSATGPSGFISAIPFSVITQDPEPRIFATRDRDGGTISHRVYLSPPPVRNIVGDPKDDSNGGRTWKRMYDNEVTRLVAERRFVQYRPKPGQQNDEHQKALTDLRFLVDQYGEGGAWLWDPYLSGNDILETLFHCKHINADLRALTMGIEVPEKITGGPIECIRRFVRRWIARSGHSPLQGTPFTERQRAAIKDAQCNLRGLRLEYRIKSGQAGWGFHDRFLIFPKADYRALAWSLGTSVNSLGAQHHILQRVDDGQPVADAFVELWEQLDQPGHLIWKAP